MAPKSELQVIAEEMKNLKKSEDVKSCRICLCEEGEGKGAEGKGGDDPIVSPCICKGSSGDIHVKCLQEWLNQKRKVSKLS